MGFGVGAIIEGGGGGGGRRGNTIRDNNWCLSHLGTHLNKWLIFFLLMGFAGPD